MSATAERRWLGPLLVAVGTMSVAIGSLVALRPGTGSPPTDAGAKPLATEHRADRGPRHALPATAWAVLDLELQRLGNDDSALPEALERLDCQRVDPPARIALALLAPGPGAGVDRFDLLVVATQTHRAFRECARRRMLEAGARQRSWPDGFDVLSRAGGLRLVIHDANALILFVNAPHLETDRLLDVWQGALPSAATQGTHAELQRELDPGADIVLTVAPPRTWLDGVAPAEEAAHSPLRFLKAAALSLRGQEIRALVDCHEAPAADEPRAPSDQALVKDAQQAHDVTGCQRLTSFLQELRDSLLFGAAEPDEPMQGWSVDPAQPLRFRARWPLPPEARKRLLSHLLSP